MSDPTFRANDLLDFSSPRVPRSVSEPSVVHGNICTIRCLKIDSVKATSTIIPQIHSTPQRSELFEEVKRNDIFSGQHSSSPLLLSAYRNAHQTLEWMLGGNFLNTLSKERQELFRLDKFQHLLRSISSKSSVTKTIEAILVLHAMGMYSQRILINRKIGVLAGGSLAILAPATRPGDEVYAFCSKCVSGFITEVHLLVLRPQLIKSGINAGNPEYETKQDDAGWGNVRHFTLIGCAWTRIDDALLTLGFTNGESARRNKLWDMRTTAWVH